MKVLFDQNLPHKLRTSLGSHHEIVTAAYMGWGELKNGELLQTAEANGMDVFVTGDGSLEFEQNLSGRLLAIVALSTNNWPIIKNHIARIRAAIDGAKPGTFQAVDCGRFSRKHSKDAPLE